MKNRVRFVDDEKQVLDGLRRALHHMKDEWEMLFIQSGKEALELMAENPIDVIVSDMRMPEMDGSALLNEVMRKHPFTARLVLSGHSDEEMILKTVGTAHQFFPKPCNIEELKKTIRNSFALRSMLKGEALRTMVAKVKNLPSMPETYIRITDELHSPDPSTGRIAKVIETDIAMSAKTLQLVNSSFFGLPNHISDIQTAVSFLGINIIRSLVLTIGVFSQMTVDGASGISLGSILDHSMMVAATAKEIIRLEGKKDEDIFIAGMIHDVGKLVLISSKPKSYRMVVTAQKHGRGDDLEVEKSIFGVTHAEVGAYLMGLWGLKDHIVEAIAFHHFPSKAPSRDSLGLVALYVADTCCLNRDNGVGLNDGLDMEYLKAVGVDNRIDQWLGLFSDRPEDGEDKNDA